jgi:hypothetical protein
MEELAMLQIDERPAVDRAPGRAAVSRRPIRIVAPTVSGRRWRRAGRSSEPPVDALAAALGRAHPAAFRAAFEPN